MARQRSLPARPSLRYLKLEAKSRLHSGEFPVLHLAQLAIAREHGQPSWAALKRLVGAGHGTDSHVLGHLKWVISRFGGAAEPGWEAPGEAEIRDHFTDEFLSQFPPADVIAALSRLAPELRKELTVYGATPLHARVRLGGLDIVAICDPMPPHLVGGAQIFPAGSRIADSRTAEPGIRATGPVPAGAAGTARTALADLGLPGLLLGGAGMDTPPWTIATGWADLDRGEVLQTSHRFPVYQLTTLVTATAVLRLVADGRAGLDDPANGYLRTVRLADDTITIRELLGHTAGVSASPDRFTDMIPDLAAVTGPVIACAGRRGVFQVSEAGYAALGQLAADLTGEAFPEAAARLVLRPLGMTSSSFPARWPIDNAITGYTVTADGSFAPAPAAVAALTAAAGLWSTGDDLVRFGLGWSSLLPRQLARQALTPHAERGSMPGHIGFGWVINEASGVCGIGGQGPGAAASLLAPIGTGEIRVALTNRPALIESVNALGLRS